MKTQNQLELGFTNANKCPRVTHRESRSNRANWWFDQMRQIADRAFEWEPAPRFQAQQILLNSSTNRG